ncbi:MAG: hypothetical protein O7D30_08460, partial [Rickettsia endosymbiont of Ixodes persulcatus]|nr:hypothetical protein [Rickettsia endosymbiont of Ixodes persulcatus]
AATTRLFMVFKFFNRNITIAGRFILSFNINIFNTLRCSRKKFILFFKMLLIGLLKNPMKFYLLILSSLKMKNNLIFSCMDY